jgi:Ca-activated chloride channel family protein
VQIAQPATVQLPKTATDAELKMMLGLVLLSLSLLLVMVRHRRMIPR